MTLRTALKRHAPTLFDAVKVVAGRHFELLPPRRTYALGKLHGEIKRRFGHAGGTFFEVGANDGVAQSNTAYLGRYLGWAGILVEAVPHKYVECVANRPDARVFHAALVPFGFDQPTIEIVYANLMSATRLSDIADVEAHVASGARFLGGEAGLLQARFHAPTITVDGILAACAYPQIDLFSIDVEGAELSVLRGIDFSRAKPRNFLIETRDLPPIQDLLCAHGYGAPVRLTHHDYLFERTPAA